MGLGFFFALGVKGAGGVFSIFRKTSSRVGDLVAMSKVDLSDAYAKWGWAKSNINVLETDIKSFFETKPYRIRAEVDPKAGQTVIKHNLVHAVPKNISASAGMSIAALRDSLDYLANALAEKNGAVDAKDIYFPIAHDEAGLRDKGCQNKIKRLGAEDRALIEALKPYKGGHPLLYSLNTLCQKSKHRKLTVFEVGPVASASTLAALVWASAGATFKTARK